MDSISILILFASVVLAFLFKYVLLKQIHRWVDQDLLASLSAGDDTRLAQLKKLDQQLREQGVSRTDRHRQLEQYNTLDRT